MEAYKMSEKKKFIWLADDCVTRSVMGRGATELKKGESYDVGEFGEKVVEVWVASGHASYAGNEKIKKGGGE